jgi:hypothetical protein
MSRISCVIPDGINVYRRSSLIGVDGQTGFSEVGTHFKAKQLREQPL